LRFCRSKRIAPPSRKNARADSDRQQWLLLDNLTMVMVNSLEATQYRPLIALDHRGITTFAAGSAVASLPGIRAKL
jgi:hypothetical protein